jgi:hypothetical protein
MPMPETPTDQERNPCSMGATAYLMGEPQASNPFGTREEGSPGYLWREGWKAEQQSAAETAAAEARSDVLGGDDDEEGDEGEASAVSPADMREALADLLEWASHTGGWDAPCWDRAKSVMRRVRQAEDAPKPKLAIVLDGGLVQCVVSDRPEMFAGLEVLTIDYDTDGADDDELSSVPQAGGTDEEAVVGWHDITQATINLRDITPLVDEGEAA